MRPARHPAQEPDSELALLLSQIREVLEQERARLYVEIASYPPPIPACDAQFNRLLERRDWIAREWARVEEAARTLRTAAACQELLGELLASADPASHQARDRLRSLQERAAQRVARG